MELRRLRVTRPTSAREDGDMLFFEGLGGAPLVAWVGVTWATFELLSMIEMEEWVASGAACAAGAAAMFALGIALERRGGRHTVSMVPVKWLGIVAPLFLGTIVGLAELLR